VAPVSQSFELLYLEKNIYIQAELTSPQDFTERAPATVHAVGSIGGSPTGIFSICVCFSGAHQISQGQPISTINEEQFAGAWLNVTETKPAETISETFSPGEYLAGSDRQIEWLNPMDSIPTIIVYYKNSTFVNGINQENTASKPYPDQAIHIESYATVETEKTDNKFFITEVSAVGLGIVQYLISVIPRRERIKPRKIS
jgi:hypothetical protein